MKNSKEKDLESKLNLLININKQPNLTQRELAKNLGISLGKLNYLLNALIDKGFIKINNFKKNPKKIDYFYLLTPHGISEKTKLTINFMRRKMSEYDQLKNELEGDNVDSD
tara:strand:+ start:1859 stop:2191 length:333 start_codon:yes stop_codon:yes gene_type:complete